MLTYQDYQKETDKEGFIAALIGEHAASREVHIARTADLYMRQMNTTINEFVQKLYTRSGKTVEDFTAANNRITSNFFNRLNTQRATYSLGNGVTFTKEGTKERLGADFDTKLFKGAKLALIHGVSFLFFNVGRVHVFPLTEFAPLYDEDTGALMAGVRYWKLEDETRERPMTAVLYELDGFTKYRREKEAGRFREIKEKRGYKVVRRGAPADGEMEIVGEENYSALPIVPLWGNELHQSTLVGMREAIDAFDLIRSGFANDLQDCAQIYWILENYGGMDEQDLEEFRDRLKLWHIAEADTSGGGKIDSRTQEIPHEARVKFLDHIRSGIYEDFGALDVHTVAAGATNDHIDAAYQPMDENADDFEYQIIEAISRLLALIGIEDTPTFKRNRISNVKEQVEILAIEAGLVDMPEEVILQQFPNFTPEQVQQALDAMAQTEADRYAGKETKK